MNDDTFNTLTEKDCEALELEIKGSIDGIWTTVEQELIFFAHEAREARKDPDHQEECNCEIVLYVRFDTPDMSITDWNINNPQMESEPYTHQDRLVIAIPICITTLPHKDDLETELITELGYYETY